MNKPSPSVTRLVGFLLTQGTDWTNPEFAALFGQLEALVEPGSVNRYVRYHGYDGNRIEIHFFGLIVNQIDRVYPDMTVLELGEHHFTVYGPASGRLAALWQNTLTWSWFDRSHPKSTLGDFSTTLPETWVSQPSPSSVNFLISGNVYLEAGKTVDDTVRLVEYDPLWPDTYKKMADWLRRTIPTDIGLRIEHYGSTAIPGIPAKPIIDILIEVPSFSRARRYLIPIFDRPECEYWWYEDHMVFIIRREFMGTRAYHIHAAPAGHRVWDGTLFRDYMRTHPAEAARYACLKNKLAGSYAYDRETYTLQKTEFITGIIDKARRCGVSSIKLD